MTEEQEAQPVLEQPAPRSRRPSTRAIGVREWQWRLMLAALALLALVMLAAIVLFILAAFGGLKFG
jgi:hypothetical protein